MSRPRCGRLRSGMLGWFLSFNLGLVLATSMAHAQFASVPEPEPRAAPQAVQADGNDGEMLYRKAVARHIYGAFPKRIYRGKLPGMLHAVLATDTQINAAGEVLQVTVVRPPAAAHEVTPWVSALIRRAAPYPVPLQAGNEPITVREIWLVDRSGRFQLDALSEGQY